MQKEKLRLPWQTPVIVRFAAADAQAGPTPMAPEGQFGSAS